MDTSDDDVLRAPARAQGERRDFAAAHRLPDAVR
jgi:hypothetical protein